MPLIYLVVRTFRLIRFVRFAPFQALSQATKKSILINLAKETAVQVGLRSAATLIVGVIADPFNRLIVPASGGRLITSRQTALQLVAHEITPAGSVAILVDPLGVFAHGVRQPIKEGQMAVFRVAGQIEESIEENLNLGFLIGGAVGGVLSPTGQQ